MNQYILTVVLKNDLDEKARNEVLDSITKQFSKVEKTDEWGSKDLAYQIKKQNKGFYVHYEFEAEPQVISSIDNKLKLDEDVLRYLLIRR